MSEMIERVAKAIAPLAWSDLAEQTWRGDAMREARTEARKMARAAIEAMREPTDDMVTAGSWNDSPRDAWREMIDAALKPSE